MAKAWKNRKDNRLRKLREKLKQSPVALGQKRKKIDKKYYSDSQIWTLKAKITGSWEQLAKYRMRSHRTNKTVLKNKNEANAACISFALKGSRNQKSVHNFINDNQNCRLTDDWSVNL